MKSINKILIIQTAFLGDVVLATSFIKSVHETYPDAQIYFLLRKGSEILLKNNPRLKKVYVWDKKDKSDFYRILKEIRSERFDCIFNLQRFFRTGLLTFLSKAKTKIGFDKNPLSFLYNKKVSHIITKKREQSYLHEVDRNNLLLKALNTEAKTSRSLELFVDEFSSDKENYIVMAPSSVWFTKKWPKEKWVELANLLVQRGFFIYMIGAPNESTYIEEIINNIASKEVKNLSGKMNLLESAALMKNARRVFVNDSAPLHLASAMNAKTTAIFCSTIKEFGFGPLSDDCEVIELDELDCKPCGLHGKSSCPLEHYKCGYDISVKKVALTV